MKLIRNSLLPLVVVGVLIGCGGGSSVDSNQRTQTPHPIDLSYQGYWVSPGYANALEISSDSVTLYKYTSDYCITQDEFDDLNTTLLERSVHLSSSADKLNWFAGYGTRQFSAPAQIFEKQAELPASCRSELLTPESEVSNEELFFIYSQIMKEYYVDFLRKDVDWDSISYAQSLNINGQPETLLEAIYQTLLPLADGHNSWHSAQGQFIKILGKSTHTMTLIEEYALANSLSYPLEKGELDETTISAINEYVETQLVLENGIINSYASSNVSYAADGNVSWFTINDIGYLRIDTMTGYSTASSDEDDLTQVTSALQQINTILDKALGDLQGTTAVIIDVRNNGGGNDYISLAIASRFTDTDFMAYKKYARYGEGHTVPRSVFVKPSDHINYTGKPVTLLVSASTASAAETFTMSMSQLDSVTVIGERTQGIFSDVMQWDLPGGHQLGLSNEVYLTPDGEWLEGKGVAVDLEVSYFSQQDRQQLRDSGILKALAVLQ